jgi:hypothetical protein
MLETTTEVQELSLEKVMETKLVQNNVTDRVLGELKEKYGNLRLAAIDDKESYLEIKAAARDCAKVRNLAVRVCKEGRDEAVKIQKQWVAKEKEVVGKVAEVEDPLDAEIARFDAEVERKANEEKKRREEAFINRQAVLSKMGATYVNESFVLGEASFEAVLIKECADDIWEESVVPAFRKEYEIIEAVKVEEQRKIAEAKAEMERQQAELRRQQEELRAAQEEVRRQKEEAERETNRKNAEFQKVRLAALLPFAAYGTYIDINNLHQYAQDEFDNLLSGKKLAYEKHKEEEAAAAEAKRQADIEAAAEAATKAEQQRQAALKKQAEIERQQAEARKAEEMAQASDLEKYKDLIGKLKAITLPEMRSGQYRKKVQMIREKIGEMIAL